MNTINSRIEEGFDGYDIEWGTCQKWRQTRSTNGFVRGPILCEALRSMIELFEAEQIDLGVCATAIMSAPGQ